MVMEKSWKLKNWPKVMEFCDQSWNLPILPLKCTKLVFLWSLLNAHVSVQYDIMLVQSLRLYLSWDVFIVYHFYYGEN